MFGKCLLPVRVPNAGEGWLDVPTGTFRRDLASELDAIKESKANTQQSYFATWDPAVRNWVPADANLISPDGLTYVWGDDVFNAKTGAIVHRIPVPTISKPYFGAIDPLAYTGDAIYMVGGGKDPPPGLWVVRTASWTLTQVTSAEGEWDLVDDKAAWGTYDGYTVRRLDLATGKVSDMYRGSPSFDYPVLVGFVGSSVLLLSPNGYGSDSPVLSVLILHPNGSVVRVPVPSGLGSGLLGEGVQDDSAFIFPVYYPLTPNGPPPSPHGWGIAAWDPSHGLQFVVTNLPQQVTVAGPCMAV